MKSLVLCIPAYNEESIIVDTLRTLHQVLSGLPADITWRLIVADNGSTDKTSKAIADAHVPHAELISVGGKGKGRAILETSKLDADYFGFIDADLSADPLAIMPMLSILESGRADIVVGSRLLDQSGIHRGFFRTLSSKIFNQTRKAIVGVRVEDSQCGLKIMNKRGLKVLRGCKEYTWFLDLEFLAQAEREGLVIKEYPIKWEEFPYEGRASRLSVVRDGLSAMMAMIRIRSRL